jgi:hypothetical protein
MKTHDERMLVAMLSGLQADLSRYVRKALEAHRGGRWPHSARNEAVLSLRMVNLAGQLQAHAWRLRSSAAATSTGVNVSVLDEVDETPANQQPPATTAEERFGLAEVGSYLQAAGERRSVALAVADVALEEAGDWAAISYILGMQVFEIAKHGSVSLATAYRMLRERDVQMRFPGRTGSAWAWR